MIPARNRKPKRLAAATKNLTGTISVGSMTKVNDGDEGLPGVRLVNDLGLGLGEHSLAKEVGQEIVAGGTMQPSLVA